MSEPQPTPETAAPATAPAPAPAAAPVAAAEPAAEPAATGTGELQPPQHWTEQQVPEDDADSSLGEDDVASSTASISSSILEYRTINGRTYHSDRASNQYWGANDDLQNDTLDIQHHVFTLLQDGRLHLAPLPEKVGKVVDIGTGTGIWVVDFGDQHPEAEVIGTDLSPIQPTWVPPNVKFEIDDFLQEWTFEPSSLDFIHERWLVGCITDWTAFFKQAHKALKPGGWVESFECNGYFESDDGTMSETSAMGQWGMIFREGTKKMGSTASFAVVRDGLQRKSLEEAGFVNIQEQEYKIPICGWPADPKLREIGQYSRAAMMNDIEGSMGFSAAQLGWSKEEIVMYAVHLRQELRSGKLHGYYRAKVVYAQKPEA